VTEEERAGMLAWYVNGRLSEAERVDLERALGAAAGPTPLGPAGAGASDDLRRDLAEFRALRAALAEVGPEEPSFPPNLIQDAWRRIQIHEREQAARAESRPAARLARFFETHVASLWRSATGVGRLALAAQLCLLIWLGAVALRPPSEVAYQTSSGPEDRRAPAPVPADRTPLRVRVMFTDAASQRDVGALLQRLGAEIVSGPSSQGLYTVAVQGAEDPERRARALDALVRALEAETALVRGVAREAP
jgi:hypothetical protein